MQAAGMTPVAVVDVDASRMEVARADFPGIETYRSVAAMLRKSDVDLVTLITAEWARRPIHIIDLACQNAKKGCSLRAKYA